MSPIGLRHLALLQAPLCAWAIQVPTPPLAEDTLLLQPRLESGPDSRALSDSLEALPVGNRIFLPLGELCRLLSFGIRLDQNASGASGFFIQEQRIFRLDTRSGHVQIGRKTSPLPQDQWRRGTTELYIDPALLAKWFPLKFQIDPKASEVVITPTERLPIQDQWQRDHLLTGRGPQGTEPLAVPIHRVPYAFLSMPMVDLSMSASHVQKDSEGGPSGTALLAGDLFWMSAQATIVRDENASMHQSTFTLFREDPRASLLGPLHARNLELGSLLVSPSLELGGSLPQARGVLLDNFPLAYRSRFAARTFHGPLLEGWSVELYQNSGLVGYQRSRGDGQYEFKDIQLRFGTNEFRLVFHGPFGEIREERSRMDIQEDQPPPGTFYYRILGARPVVPDLDASQSDFNVVRESFQHPLFMAQAEYGLSRTLALHSAVSDLYLPDGLAHRYDEIGGRLLTNRFSLQGNASREVTDGAEPGLAANAVFRTGFSYSSFQLQRSEYRRGFQVIEEMGNTSNPQLLRNRTLAQYDANTTLARIPASMTFAYNGKRYTDGTSTETANAKTTLTFSNSQFSPGLAYTFASSTQSPAWDLEMYWSSRYRQTEFQANLAAHRQAGATTLQSWGCLANYTTLKGVSFQSELRGSQKLADTTLLGSVSRQQGTFGYGAELQYGQNTGYGIRLRLQASFGREPRSHRWMTQATSTATAGAISAVTFLDANSNGRRDPGERLIEGGQITVANNTMDNQIKDHRITFISGLAKNQELDIRLDDSGLEEPSLLATVKSYRIIPRPGAVYQLDFPVGVFGSVDGTLRYHKGTHKTELPGVEVELTNAARKVRLQQRSAYDGYFEFNNVPPGDYVLSLSEADIRRLAIEHPPVRHIRIDAKKYWVAGQDLIVEGTP
nr:carboxypeptidase-like regulatory domain-containing protein [uncultured Holophaga sp.]